jgi:hypothetical protein
MKNQGSSQPRFLFWGLARGVAELGCLFLLFKKIISHNKEGQA